MKINRKRVLFSLLIVLVLLLLPWVSMQFTSEVNWSIFDFVIAALLLGGTALFLEIVLTRFKDKKSRLLFSIGLFLLLITIWAELAVGIFGTPFAGN